MNNTQIDAMEHFQLIADDYDKWKARNSYYYKFLQKAYMSLVPAGRSVIEIGCGTGDILNCLKPSRGTGIDISERMIDIAKTKYPALNFIRMDARNITLNEKFDFVIIPDLMEHVDDVRAVVEGARNLCCENSRIIISTVNPLWSLPLKLAERMHLKMPEGKHRWVWAGELKEYMRQGRFEVLSTDYLFACPINIPGVSNMLNKGFSKLPAIRKIGIIYCMQGRLNAR